MGNNTLPLATGTSASTSTGAPTSSQSVLNAANTSTVANNNAAAAVATTAAANAAINQPTPTLNFNSSGQPIAPTAPVSTSATTPTSSAPVVQTTNGTGTTATGTTPPAPTFNQVTTKAGNILYQNSQTGAYSFDSNGQNIVNPISAITYGGQSAYYNAVTGTYSTDAAGKNIISQSGSNQPASSATAGLNTNVAATNNNSSGTTQPVTGTTITNSNGTTGSLYYNSSTNTISSDAAGTQTLTPAQALSSFTPAQQAWINSSLYNGNVAAYLQTQSDPTNPDYATQSEIADEYDTNQKEAASQKAQTDAQNQQYQAQLQQNQNTYAASTAKLQTAMKGALGAAAQAAGQAEGVAGPANPDAGAQASITTGFAQLQAQLDAQLSQANAAAAAGNSQALATINENINGIIEQAQQAAVSAGQTFQSQRLTSTSQAITQAQNTQQNIRANAPQVGSLTTPDALGNQYIPVTDPTTGATQYIPTFNATTGQMAPPKNGVAADGTTPAAGTSGTASSPTIGQYSLNPTVASDPQFAGNTNALAAITKVPTGYQGYLTAGPGGTVYLGPSQMSDLSAGLQQSISIAATNAGIPVLTSNQESDVKAVQTVYNSVNDLQALAQVTLGSGLMGRLAGMTLNQAEQYLQESPTMVTNPIPNPDGTHSQINLGVALSQFSQYRVSAINSIQALATGSSGSGLRISAPEIAAAAQNLPTSSDNLEAAMTAISTFDNVLNNKLSTMLPEISAFTPSGTNSVTGATGGSSGDSSGTNVTINGQSQSINTSW